MAKQYIFYKADIINLLLNHKIYLSKKIKDALNNGESINTITYGRTALWTEEFFDEEVEKGEVKLEDILDEVDTILEKTHGITILERARQMKGTE